MVRKPAPGGGRKPLGEFKGKTATITTRVTPQTRTALEQRARARDRSLSQEIERCLQEVISWDRDDDAAHVRGLAHAIQLAIVTIERKTQRRWLDDPFTCEAVRLGVETLLFHFRPEGALVVPARVAAASARMPAELAERYRTPVGLAQTETHGLIGQIETPYEPHEKYSPEVHYPEEWYAYSQIRHDIGSASTARRKNWKIKETGQ
jgi:predicted transcriptional regulator